MNVISIDKLTKKYGKLAALSNLSLEVGKGSIYGLVGPNGSGKSTLIKAIVGALRPTSGSITVMGGDPLKNRGTLRKKIGYMPQSPALYDDLTAKENISFYARVQEVKDIKKKVSDIIEFTELTDRANEPVKNFSGGMQKRVSLACALVHDPEILFLDEPTAAIDPHLKLRSWALFRRLANRGVTLFISTHLMDEALFCDHITILRAGELIAVDTPQNILALGCTKVEMETEAGTESAEIPSNSVELAMLLQKHGLSSDVKSVSVSPQNLEEIILNLISKKS